MLPLSGDGRGEFAVMCARLAFGSIAREIVMQKSFFGLSGFLAGASLAVAAAQAADKSCGKWETSFGSLAGEGEALNTSFCS